MMLPQKFRAALAAALGLVASACGNASFDSGTKTAAAPPSTTKPGAKEGAEGKGGASASASGSSGSGASSGDPTDDGSEHEAPPGTAPNAPAVTPSGGYTVLLARYGNKLSMAEKCNAYKGDAAFNALTDAALVAKLAGSTACETGNPEQGKQCVCAAGLAPKVTQVLHRNSWYAGVAAPGAGFYGECHQANVCRIVVACVAPADTKNTISPAMTDASIGDVVINAQHYTLEGAKSGQTDCSLMGQERTDFAE